MDDRYSYPDVGILKSNSDEKKEFVDKSNELSILFKQMRLNAEVVYVEDKDTSVLYAIKLGPGVRVSKLTILKQEISVVLETSDLQIHIPIPGTQYIGVQALKSKLSTFLLGDLVKNHEFVESDNNMEIILGRTFDGEYIPFDFNRLPHILISGTTGSGKSVFLDSMIVSLLYKNSPDELKFILLDTHAVTFLPFSEIPHLAMPIVNDAKKAVSVLNWALAEMMSRYKLFTEELVRDIDHYNASVSASDSRLPRIMIVIDDYADLMTLSSSEVESSICRLAQMSRASGIHLVISTQRPSVDVLTGIIKSNMPNRLAFSMASNVDSRTVLDTSGAEELKGKGDMLYKSIEYRMPIRVQGPYVSEIEIYNVVDYIKSHNLDYYSGINIDDGASAGKIAKEKLVDVDELLYDVGITVINNQKASIGMIQRKYKIGFNRAARLLDELERMGVVSHEDGTRPRDILMTNEEFKQLIHF